MDNPYLEPLVCSPTQSLAESLLDVCLSLEKGGPLPECYPHLLTRFWKLYQGDTATRWSIMHENYRRTVVRNLARHMGVMLPHTGSVTDFDTAATKCFEPLYSNLEAVRCGAGDRELAKKLLLQFHEICVSDMWKKSQPHRFVA